jgi:hypothetical protein
MRHNSKFKIVIDLGFNLITLNLGIHSVLKDLKLRICEW